jgi:hypothetical protein
VCADTNIFITVQRSRIKVARLNLLVSTFPPGLRLHLNSETLRVESSVITVPDGIEYDDQSAIVNRWSAEESSTDDP